MPAALSSYEGIVSAQFNSLREFPLMFASLHSVLVEKLTEQYVVTAVFWAANIYMSVFQHVVTRL